VEVVRSAACRPAIGRRVVIREQEGTVSDPRPGPHTEPGEEPPVPEPDDPEPAYPPDDPDTHDPESDEPPTREDPETDPEAAPPLPAW
jgi:hypothetical protein